MVGVAFRRENVFVSPDMYMFSPGGKLYIEAANGSCRTNTCSVRAIRSAPSRGSRFAGVRS